MYKSKIIALLFCVFMSVSVSFAQNTTAADTTSDKHETNMKYLIFKLIRASSDNFSKVKGKEVSRKNNSIFYDVILSNLISDFEQMKKALADDLFGAMLTTDDNIVETSEGAIYLARYKDDYEDGFSVTEMVTKAFTGMPCYLGLTNALEKLQGRSTDEHLSTAIQ